MANNHRRRLQMDERRAQLLELGLRLFSARSYEDVSIGDIAREAGISKGLLYHYFGGKRDFYVAIVQLAADRLLADIEASAVTSEDHDPIFRVQAGLTAYLNFVEQRAEAFMALMFGGLGADRQVSKIIDTARRTIAHWVLQGMELNPPPPALRLAARSWIGAVEAASLDWLEHRDLNKSDLIKVLSHALQGYAMSALEITESYAARAQGES